MSCKLTLKNGGRIGAKGPSTHGEEFVDEVSTNSRRSLSEGFFEVFLRWETSPTRIFNLIF